MYTYSTEREKEGRGRERKRRGRERKIERERERIEKDEEKRAESTYIVLGTVGTVPRDYHTVRSPRKLINFF